MGMEIGSVEYRNERVGLEVWIWDWQYSIHP